MGATLPTTIEALFAREKHLTQFFPVGATDNQRKLDLNINKVQEAQSSGCAALILWRLPWLKNQGLTISADNLVALAELAIEGGSKTLLQVFEQALKVWDKKNRKELAQSINIVKILFLNRTSETPHTRGQLLVNLIKYGFYSLAVELLSAKCDIELSYVVKNTAKEEGQVDKEAGFSALHFAVAHEQVELVKSLCKRGSPQLADQRARTPLQMAMAAQKTQIVTAILTESSRLMPADVDAALCYLLEQQYYDEALHGLYQHEAYLRFDNSCNALKLASEHGQGLLVFHLAFLGAPKVTGLTVEMQGLYDDGQQKSRDGFDQNTIQKDIAGIKDTTTAQAFVNKFSQLSPEKQKQLVPEVATLLSKPKLIEVMLASEASLEKYFFADDASFGRTAFVALVNEVVSRQHLAAVFLLLAKWDFILSKKTILFNGNDLNENLLSLVEQYLKQNQITFSKQLYVNYFAMLLQCRPLAVVNNMLTVCGKKLDNEQLKVVVDAILTSPLPAIYQSLARLAPALAQAIRQIGSEALAQRFLIRTTLRNAIDSKLANKLALLTGYHTRYYMPNGPAKRREKQFKETVEELPRIKDADPNDAVSAVEKNSAANFAKAVTDLEVPSTLELMLPEIKACLQSATSKKSAVESKKGKEQVGTSTATGSSDVAAALTRRENAWLAQRLEKPVYAQHAMRAPDAVRASGALLSSNELKASKRKTGNDNTVFFAPKFGNNNTIPPYLQEHPIVEINLTELFARDSDEAKMWITTDTPMCYSLQTMMPLLEIANVDVRIVYQKRKETDFLESREADKILLERVILYRDKKTGILTKERFEMGDEFIVGANIIEFRYLRILKQLRIISSLLRHRRDYDPTMDPYERMLGDPNDPLNEEVIDALTRVRGCEFNKIAEQRIDIPEASIILVARQPKVGRVMRSVSWGDGNRLKLRGRLAKAAGLKSLDTLKRRLAENPNVNWTPGTIPNTSPILAVVASRSVAKVRYLLAFPYQDQTAIVRYPVDVNAHTFGGSVCYPLTIAVANGDLEIVQLLIQYGADVKKQGGLTLVKEAITNKHYQIALELLTADTYLVAGAATFEESMLVELLAVEYGFEVFKKLENKYPDVKVDSNRIKIKLNELVRQQQADAIVILLKNCVARNFLEQQDYDAALEAAIKVLINCDKQSEALQAIQVVQAIFKNGKLSKQSQTEALLNLIAHKYGALAMALIQNKKCHFDFDAVLDPNGANNTGLHYAVRYGQTELAAMLCQQGAKQLPDGKGQIPMQLAVAQKKTALVKVMLDNTPSDQLDKDSYNYAREYLLACGDREALTAYDTKYSSLLVDNELATKNLIAELTDATERKSSKWSLLFFKDNKDKRERLGGLLKLVKETDGTKEFAKMLTEWGEENNNYGKVCRSRTRIGFFSSGKVTSRDLVYTLGQTYGACKPIKSS